MANPLSPADAANNLDAQTAKATNADTQTPAALLKDAGAGVPDRKLETPDSGTTLPERFRNAAGIDNIPNAGTVNGTARKVEDEANFGGAVRVRPKDSMVTPDGNTVNGRLYTVKGQEYFAQTEGENRRIYTVNRNENGVPTLEVKPPRNSREAAANPDAALPKPELPVAKVEPAVIKPEPVVRENPTSREALAAKGEVPALTTPAKTERELRAEQNAGVLNGTGDLIQAKQAPELANLRAAAEAQARAQALALNPEVKSNPIAVNPGTEIKPGLVDNKANPTIPVLDGKGPGSDKIIPAQPIVDIKMPGSDNKPINNPIVPAVENRPAVVDNKALQQIVSETKQFQQQPPERQAEIIKTLTEVQRQVNQPNLVDKPQDLAGKPVDTGIRVNEPKAPDRIADGKPGDIIPGRVLDAAGNPLKGPDGNPIKFSDLVAAGIKPGDILKPGDIAKLGEGLKPGDGVKPGDGLKPGEALKPGEGLKLGDAQKGIDALTGKAIDPALVGKLGELTGPGGKLAADGTAVNAKDTKGGAAEVATNATASALSDMAKALGLGADATKGLDGKVGTANLSALDGALKNAADAAKPTGLEVGAVGAKGLVAEAGKIDSRASDLKGLDAARPDAALNMAAKLPTDGLLPGARDGLKDGLKADGIGVKTEVTGKILDPTGRPETIAQKIEGALSAPLAAAQRVEADKNAPTVKVEQVVVAGDKADTTNTTKIELDPDKKATDTAGSAAKFDELLDKAKKQREEEKLDEEDQLNSRNAMMMALLAQKKQKQEQDEKELQLRNEDPKKKDDDKRRRYVVKEKETLESIAKKQLRDVRLAALIYEINKHMLPVRMEKGKQVVDPRPGTAIWLPTEAQIKEFRMRLYAASNTDAGAAAPGKFASVDDELAAKFGAGWDGNKPAVSAADGMMGSAVAKSQARRENIEKILGPMSEKPSDSARIRYIVRLTDSIESVAQKHPALKDATLWPLVASINHLPAGLDQFGRPLAELRRGMVLDIPLPYEIERFKLEGDGEEPSDIDEDDYEEDSEDAPSVNVIKNLGVETADSTPALPSDFQPTVKVKASHPLIASPGSASVSSSSSLPAVAPNMASQTAASAANLASTIAAQAISQAPVAVPAPIQNANMQQPQSPQAPTLAKAPFPFAASAAALPAPNVPLPTATDSQANAPQAPLPRVTPAASSAPITAPLSYQAAPVTSALPQHPGLQQPVPDQQLKLQQAMQQHTVVSQPVVPQAPANAAPQANPPAQSPAQVQAGPQFTPQPGSQTDTNPVLSAVPVISQIQGATGALPAQMKTALDQPPIDAGDRFIWQLDPSVRLVKSTMKWEPSVGVFRSQLELLLDEIWYPVIFYEVFPQMAVRHEYIGGGRKKSVKMDLPPTPAQELADNDLINNWQRYCHTFVAQMNGPKTGPPT